MKKRTLPFVISFVALSAALLACAGTPENLQISGLPQYICPSATPRLTDTPRPTSPPTFPLVFQANLNYGYVDVTRSLIRIQYLAQNLGAIQLVYSGVNTAGALWSGNVTMGFAPMNAPGITGSYALVIPPDVNAATLSVIGGYSATFMVTRYPYPVSGSPNPPPCCLPPPIYPTPVPTYTPYPTPTPYVRTNDYFLGDPVYAVTSTLRIRFRVTDITAHPAPPDRDGSPRQVYVWQLEVKNIGTVEYDFLPAAHMYVSEIRLPDGAARGGVWGPSLEAAQTANVTPTYDPAALQGGQSQSFTLAAFGPLGTVSRVSYALDLTGRGNGPTQVPGRQIVSWLNQVNTVCTGEIKEP